MAVEHLHRRAGVGGGRVSARVVTAEVKARGDVKITTPINQMGSALRGFYTEDPDGLPVEFVQSMK